MKDDNNSNNNIKKKDIKKYVQYSKNANFYEKSCAIIEKYIREKKIITPPILAKERNFSLQTARKHLKRYLTEQGVEVKNIKKKKESD